MLTMNNHLFADYPDVVSPEQVAEMLHLGRNTVYGLLQDGLLKSARIGKKYIIPKQSVIAFVQSICPSSWELSDSKDTKQKNSIAEGGPVCYNMIASFLPFTERSF